MAVAHIDYNRNSQHGSALRNALTNLESAFEQLNQTHATMALMFDGDGSDASHFAYMQGKFGFADNAAAKAAFDELASLLFKLNTNSSVSDVNAAMTQAFNKFR